MLTLIVLLSTMLIGGLAFATTTSAIANGGDYLAIPQIVRDFYSKEVLFLAQPRCKFLQFAKVKRDLQAVRGKSIVFVKYNNLSGGGQLLESDTLTPVGMSAAEISIAVHEQANAIQISEMLMRTSLLDILGDSTKLLANNLAVVLDGQFRDACLATTNVVFGNGAATATDVTTGSVFNSRAIKDAVQVLATNNAPKFQGEYYVCFAHPVQTRQLRDDTNWINANTYMGRRQLYVGEVGMYEGVIFIETTQMPHLDDAGMQDIYTDWAPPGGCQAVVLGENAFAWAIALDVELRDDGIKEFGRKRALGWYGIWGTGLIEGRNVVTIATAAPAP